MFKVQHCAIMAPSPRIMDRSKFRNPEMPVGYTKVEAELVYKYGEVIDGEHYVLAPYIWNANIFDRPDFDTLSDLEFSEDDSIAEDIAADEPSPIPPVSVEVAKEAVSIKKEPDDKSTSKKCSPSKHRKKGHDNVDSSDLEASVSHMSISHAKHTKKKKEKKIKKEPKDDYDSGSVSSRHSSSPKSSRKYKLVRYSPSPSPEREPPNDEYPDVKVKIEPLDQTQHLFGSYHCDVCNITMNSLLTYNTHVNGKKHRKNMKVKNVSEAVAQSIPATAVSEESKYPKARSNVIRKRVQELAKIQGIIEEKVKTPCPGLNKVIEIQGIEAVQYYCSMCDSVCSSNSIIAHLTGFKHQLKSVKEFKPGSYDRMSYEPKYKIEKDVQSILRAVQKKDGMGRMAVEVEKLLSSSKSKPFSEPSKDYRSQPSTSRDMGREHSGMSFPDLYDKATVPDQFASDFYCEVCDSHMNSIQMWEAHIRGKRHLTNLKKMPGDRPSKNKTIFIPNREAYLLFRLDTECPDEPAVGLREIRETEIHETNSHSYQCFLCGSCHTHLDIIDHVISLKHRTKFLDHINYPEKEVIAGMSDSAAVGLVKAMCQDVENERGRDKPPVYMSKSSIY